MVKRQPLRAFKVYREGYIVEVAIYQVPVSAKTPQGYRFRCFLIDPTSGEELVGYDNHWPKGPHRHFRGREDPTYSKLSRNSCTILNRTVHAFSKKRETMKLRKIHVIVKPWAEVWEEEKRIARQLDRGEKDSRWAQDTLYFTSLEELRQVLTDRRLELLRLIHKERPDSIKALATRAGRDLKNVNADVHLLARLGLIDLTEEKAGPQRRGRKSPRVPYAAVSVEIAL